MTRSLACSGLGWAWFLLAASAVSAADGVELRWKLQKGQVHNFLLKHQEIRTVEFAKEKRETTTSTEYEWQWTVTDIDDQGVADLEQKLTGLRVASTGQDFEFAYDSSRGNDSSDDYKKKLIHLYDQLRFAKYRVRLKPDGQVAEVAGFDKILREAAVDSAVIDFNGHYLHDEVFGWYLQQVLGRLSSEAATQWQAPVDAKLASMGEVTGQVECLLQAKPVMVGEYACQEFKWSGSHALELDMKWLNSSLHGTLKSSKMAGTVRFDAAAGIVRSSQMETTIAGKIKIGSGDSGPALDTTLQSVLEFEMKP